MSFRTIEVQNLGKTYRVASSKARYKTLREEAFRFLKPRVVSDTESSQASRDFWALQNVNFNVHKGEILGIIGRNGAGKSTLLKILSRITEPTTGGATIYGRVGSLLEVGTGFHGELSGRENVYLNGAILGMTKREIDKKFDEIVSFAEVEKFIDLPVKHYSSGMAVRLAFSVAAHLDTDIMLIDEVLTVGDIGFQRKCASLLSRSISDGRTSILVSHTMGLIRTLCSRVILLEGGTVYKDGTPDEVLNSYYHLMSTAQSGYKPNNSKVKQPLFVSSAYLTNQNELPIYEVPCGEGLRVVLEFQATPDAKIDRPKVHLKINSESGDFLSYLGNTIAGHYLTPIEHDTKVICEVENLNLGPGEYSIGFIVADGERVYDQAANALSFTVTTADFYGSGVLPESRGGRVLFRSKWWTEPVKGAFAGSTHSLQNG
jgi:lipopolysaccharide transport system ATP-binding protein